MWVRYRRRPGADIITRQMCIRVNGEEKHVDEGLSVAALIAELKLTPDRVAIELNRRLIKGERYGQALKEGDEVEIVTFVGGG